MMPKPSAELSALASKHIVPLDVTWEITKHCNIRCLPCYSVQAERDELSLEDGMRVIHELAGEKTLYVTFTGGEPFLRKHELFMWAFEAQKQGMAVSIFTNGTLLNEEDIERLKKLSPFAVHVSMFSITSAVHDAMTRVRGSHARTHRTIMLLRQAHIPVIIKTLLTNENYSERKKMIDFAVSIGAAWSLDPLVIPRETGNKKPLELRLTDQETEEVFNDTARYVVPRFKPNSLDEFQCGAGVNMAAISAYGDVYPCLMYPKSAGNVREDSFARIWCKSDVLYRIRNTSGKDIEPCRHCALLSYCSRCPGLALLEDHDENGKSSSSCRLARITKKYVEKGVHN